MMIGKLFNLNMFDIMAVFMPLMFLFAFGSVVVIFVKQIGQWNKNNHSPRLTVEAYAVAKRTNVSRHHSGNSMHHTSTTYYITFEVASGDRMELMVDGSDYGMIIEGDFGDLTFQGTRYLSFERKNPEAANGKDWNGYC